MRLASRLLGILLLVISAVSGEASNPGPISPLELSDTFSAPSNNFVLQTCTRHRSTDPLELSDSHAAPSNNLGLETSALPPLELFDSVAAQSAPFELSDTVSAAQPSQHI